MSGAEIKRYANDIRAIAEAIEGDVDEVVAQVGRYALDTARQIAPVKSGEMRDALRLTRQATARYAVESPTRQGVFQEYGTSVMAPQPTIGPTVDIWAPRLVKELERLADGIAKDLS